jgi:phospholipase C
MTNCARLTCLSLAGLCLLPLIIGCGAPVYVFNGPNETPDIAPTGTIQHVVVIYQENVSFDHYFGTYPNALNLPGEQPFVAIPGTPAVDGLTGSLLLANPNASNNLNGPGATNPFRLSPAHAATADQSHAYNAEQVAFNGGSMDLFPLSVGAADSPSMASGVAATTGLTMAYFDGNTVTGLWNYAQHYAMSDSFFGTTFGPSTIGAINLISGQTNGVVNDLNAEGNMVDDGSGGHTLIANADPVNDVCSNTSGALVHMTGQSIGHLLSVAGITWGFFAEGFDLTVKNANGTTGCHRSHTSPITGVTSVDYVPHHEGFQYYAASANPTHARPLSTQMISHANDGGTHHQYDLHDFFDAVKAGNFPAVSFLKSAAYRDGHAGYSDPLDEQGFITNAINIIEQTPQWKNTIIIVAYDDSDGWYDHANNVVNGSATPQDAFSAPGQCGDGTLALPGVSLTTGHAQGRCGYGPRLPILVISPWAKPNYVSHALTDQTSILRFIEDNFINQQSIGQGSFDTVTGSIGDMLDFSQPTPQNGAVILLNTKTGAVVSTN